MAGGAGASKENEAAAPAVRAARALWYVTRRMDAVARLEKRILRAAAQAIQDFGLVEDGDRIMVAVSGGKDSYTLLHVLMRLRERAPIDFELVAVNLDQGQPGLPGRRWSRATSGRWACRTG